MNWYYIARWIIYSMIMWVLLMPFHTSTHTESQHICGALILGFFAGLLNEIVNHD